MILIRLKLVNQIHESLMDRLISITGKRSLYLISQFPFIKTINDLSEAMNKESIIIRTLTHAQAIARQVFGQVLKAAGKRTDRRSDFPL
jgi:hypothetical protein